MAEYTQNYNLEKQQGNDYVRIDGLNGNFDIIDSEIKKVNDNKVDKEDGKGLSSNDYTTLEKNKLAGIAEKANNYVHPTTHPPGIIAQDANNRFVTDSEKAAWNGKAGTAVATTSANGLMSAADKTKLNGIATGANNYVHPSTHPASMITGLPTTLPANGGNSDTVDGYHIQVQAAIPGSLGNNVICLVYE